MTRAATPPPRPTPTRGNPAPTTLPAVRGTQTYNTALPGDPVGKLNQAAAHARRHVVGRRPEIDLLELSILARSNVLQFGPPGTAKTLVADIMTSCIDKASVFSTMLTKFTKPGEIFGPMDLEAFKKGVLRTHTQGFLPSATIGVIDETFKGSSAILNSLLTIANERRFRDGAEWIATPTRTLIGMSNELPEDATLLGAFYDRFPLKLWSEYLDDPNFAMMLDAPEWDPTAKPPVTINAADLAEIDRRMAEVVIDPEVKRIICDIRRMLAASKVSVSSDRRFRQALKIIKAQAVRAGRATATADDVRPLRYIFWNRPEEAAKVAEIVDEFTSPMAKAIKEQLKELAGCRQKVAEAASQRQSDADKTVAATQAASRELGAVRNIAARLEQIARGASALEQEACNMASQAAAKFSESAHAMASGQITVQEFLNRTEVDLTINF